MRTSPRLLTALATALLVAAPLAGCSLADRVEPQPTPTTAPPTARQGTLLPKGTTEVELAVGETVQVSLGQGSPGVGDTWGVVSQTDESTASADVEIGDAVFGTAPGTETPAPVGGSRPYAVELTGVGPGTTTVRVLYCTRAAIAEGCDQSQGTLDPPVDPVEITVTVR